jgi:hypothetical protein
MSEKQAASSLKMEAAVLYEMLAPERKTVWRHMPEDLSPDIHLRENLNSQVILSGCDFACYCDCNCACCTITWQKASQ